MSRAAVLLLALLVNVSLPVSAAATDAPDLAPAGAAITVTDGAITLTHTDVAAATPKALAGGVTHTLRVSVQTRSPASGVAVTVAYSINGTEPSSASPTKTLTSDGTDASGNLRFKTTFSGTDLGAAPDTENPIKFTVRTTFSASTKTFPTTGSYSYVNDQRAPVVGTPTFNGATTNQINSADAVTIGISATDVSNVASVGLILSRGTASYSYSLTYDSGSNWKKVLSTGLGIPDGVYSVQVQSTDGLGHYKQTPKPDLIVGSAPPQPAPRDDAVTVSDSLRTLNVPVLDCSRGLDADHTQIVYFTTNPGASGETVAVKLLYEASTALPSASSPQVAMQRVSTNATAWVYRAELPLSAFPGAAGEHLVKFRFQSTSSYYGVQTLPESSAYCYVRDGQAPTFGEPHLNGRATITIGGNKPLLFEIPITDMLGIDAANVQVRSATGAIVYQHTLYPDGQGSFRTSEATGLGLSEGTYDALFTATDSIGHTRAPLLVTGAITVDNTPPTIGNLTVNGNENAVIKPTSMASFQVTVVAGTNPSTVSLKAFDSSHVLRATWSLAAVSAGVWGKNFPTGPGLPDGTYSFRVEATDDVGNAATDELQYPSLIVDGSPPSITLDQIMYPNGRSSVTSGGAVTVRILTGDASPVTTVILAQGAEEHNMNRLGGTNTFTGTLIGGTTNGNNAFTVRATDSGGNVGSTNFGFIVDKNPPTFVSSDATYQAGRNYALNGETLHLRVRATDAETQVYRVIMNANAINGGTGNLEAIQATGTNEWSADTTMFASIGSFTVPVTIYDDAGNTATASIPVDVGRAGTSVAEVTIDGQTALSVTASRAFSFHAKVLEPAAVSGATFILRDTAGTIRATIPLTAQGAGVYSKSQNPNLPDGQYVGFTRVSLSGGGQANLTTVAATLTINSVVAPVTSTGSFNVNGLAPSEGDLPVTFYGATTHIEAEVDATVTGIAMSVIGPSGTTDPLTFINTDGHLTADWTPIELGMTTIKLTSPNLSGPANQAIKVIPSTDNAAPGPVTGITLTNPGAARPHATWQAPGAGAQPIDGYAATLDAAAPARRMFTGPEWTALSDVAPGPHTLHVTPIDHTGHVGPEALLAFTVASPASAATPAPNALGLGVAANAAATIPNIIGEQLPATNAWVPIPKWKFEGDAASLTATDCVDVLVGINGKEASSVTCVRDTQAIALGSLPLSDGNLYSMKLRVKMLDGRVGSDVNLGSTKLNLGLDPASLIKVKNGVATLMVPATSNFNQVLVDFMDSTGAVVDTQAAHLNNGSYELVIPANLADKTMRISMQDAAGNHVQVNHAPAALAISQVAQLPKSSKIGGWLILGTILIAVGVGGFYGYRYLTKVLSKKKPAPAKAEVVAKAKPRVRVHHDEEPEEAPVTQSRRVAAAPEVILNAEVQPANWLENLEAEPEQGEEVVVTRRRSARSRRRLPGQDKAVVGRGGIRQIRIE